jgi:hypothetical protein
MNEDANAITVAAAAAIAVLAAPHPVVAYTQPLGIRTGTVTRSFHGYARAPLTLHMCRSQFSEYLWC